MKYQKIKNNTKISLSKNDTSFLTILLMVIFMSLPVLSFAQQKDETSTYPVTGTVYDENGIPIAGAIIIQTVGETISTTTDEKGYFSLNLTSSKSTIQVSMLGYMKQKIQVKGKHKFDIVLEPDNSTTLNESVVLGLFSKAKNSFTGTAVTVEGKDLRMVNNTSFFDALKVFDPSFQVIDQREMNGSNPNVVPSHISIRGENSFPDISEGSLKTSVSLPIFILDGFEVSIQKIYDLDMTRIESVTILKDASASAIYGSRAANGVVVVETKNPQAGKLNVSYTLNGGFQIPDLSSYNLMNASQVLEFQEKAGLFNASTSGQDAGAKMNSYNLIKREILAGVDTDWLSKPLRTGFQQHHSVFIEGSANSESVNSPKNIRYSVNLSYSQTNGVMKDSDRDTYGAGTKFIFGNNNLRMTNDLQFSRTTSKDSPYGSFSTYTTLLPYHRETDTNGNYFKNLSLANVAPDGMTLSSYFSQKSPVYEAKYLNSFSADELLNVSDNIGLNWTITNDLRVRGSASIAYDFTRSDIYVSPMSYSSATDEDAYTPDALFKRGKYELGNTRTMTYAGNGTISYTKSLGKHDFQGIVGGEIREIQRNSDSYVLTGFLNDALSHPSFATQYEQYGHPSGSESTVRTVGAFSNLNYAYASRYLLDLTGRIDGSSLYGRNNQFLHYWSAGVRWNADYETFIKEIGWVDKLVLRANIGTTGNQNYQLNQAMNLYTYLPYSYGNFFGASISTLGNPDLTGQKTTNRNLGLEFALFNNIFNLNFNYYNNITKRNLTDLTIAPSIGFASYKTNMGDLENKGIEFNLSIVPIRTRDMLLNITIRGAKNTNKIKKISDALKKYNETINGKADEGSVSTVFLFKEGESMNTIYAVRSLGIDPGTGKEIFLTADGQQTFDWKAKDQVAVGVNEPDLQGSFGFNFRYRVLELGADFSYSFGADKYNYTLYERIEAVNYSQNNDLRALTDRWQQPGDIAQFKAIGDNSVTRASSRFVQRENRISLSSLRLSYTMPSEQLRGKLISYLRFSVTGNDLFYASTIKQERGLSYPFTRSVSFSAQVNF